MDLTISEALQAIVLGSDSLTNSLIVIEGDQVDPILKQEKKFRGAQAKYFLDIVTLFFSDYIFPKSEDECDVLWLKEFNEILQPQLLELIKKIGFPDPGNLEAEEKNFIKIILEKFKLFFVHMNSTEFISIDELLLKNSALLKQLNQERKKCGLCSIKKDPLELKRQIIAYFHQILLKILNDKKNPFLNVLLPFVANRLCRLLFKMTGSGFLSSILKKLLNETFISVDKPPPLEHFDAGDIAFSRNIGDLIFQLCKELIQFGRPSGVTKYAMSWIESLVQSRKEFIGESVQKALSRMLQSSSRLQLFYVLSLIFWKQTDSGWQPYLNELTEKSSSREEQKEIVSLLNNKLSIILGIQTNENTSYAFRAISAVVGIEGSLPQFCLHLSKSMANLLQNQSAIMYAVIYILEGILEHLNEVKIEEKHE